MSSSTTVSRSIWDIKEFSHGGKLPKVIGKYNQHFPYDRLNPIRVQDLPLHMPGQGWQIPGEIENGFVSLLQQIMAHEQSVYEDDADGNGFYVYITIDQKPVAPNQTQRRPGFHSDSYAVDPVAATRDRVMLDHIYLCTDALPTEFVAGPFNVDRLSDPSNCEAVLALFEDQAAKQEIITYEPFTILSLTPYCIHRAARNCTQQTTERTFVKVVITHDIHNREGNTVNKGFVYDWKMMPRDRNVRNHPSAPIL